MTPPPTPAPTPAPSAPEPTARRGRRSAGRSRRRPDTVTVLAAALPLLALGGALLVGPRESVTVVQPPTEGQLERIDRVCPGATDAGPVMIANAEGTEGRVRLRELLESSPPPEGVKVGGNAVATREALAPVALSAVEEPAVGLVATRSDASPLAAVSCPEPTAETWFTGLGARLDHDSVLELDNPDTGAAVVDLTVYSGRGELEASDLKGISVPGLGTVTIDLASVLPRRGFLAVRADVSRGRATVSVIDRVGLQEEEQRHDWVAGQAEPSLTNLVLGLPPGDGTRTLVLANPNDNEAVATLQFVTDTNVFTPADVEEIRIRPGGVVPVPLDGALATKVARGSLGLVVTATEPVTASLSATIDGDPAATPSAVRLEDRGAALVPDGTGTLVLAGAAAAGTVQVDVFDADGTSLLDRAVDVTPDAGEEIALPDGAALVTVLPSGTTISAAIVLADRDGATVLPVTDLPRHSLAPYVGPVLGVTGQSGS
ncbi:MAG: hypothetical protein KDB63_06130 [Nocardioidaceae bacterium]|nr:hypothetical protein [Nocardioidaceae bacterium]